MEAIQFPLQASFAHAFAQEWIDAWNSHDLERVLSHYADDVVLTSPVALKLQSEGQVRGKQALRDYFERGLKAYPDLRFDFQVVLWGLETIVLMYLNNFRGGRTAEVMQFNAAGKVTRVWAHYER